MAPGERPLDPFLLCRQPVEGRVDLALLDDAEAEDLAETDAAVSGLTARTVASWKSPMFR